MVKLLLILIVERILALHRRIFSRAPFIDQVSNHKSCHTVITGLAMITEVQSINQTFVIASW